MSYQEFWARVYCAALGSDGIALNHCAEVADNAAKEFMKRFPAEAEAKATGAEINRRVATGEVPDWSK